MRRLERPSEPNSFTSAYNRFIKTYPVIDTMTESIRWEAWKNNCQHEYAEVKTVLEENQNGLCAFCEIKLTETNKQIEHFIPKSLATETEDWTLTFENFSMACKGNTNIHSPDYSAIPSREVNYSCGHKKDNIDPREQILNPYELPDYPIFKLNIIDGGIALAPDIDACNKAEISIEIVESTIELLGLNTPNLLRLRKTIYNLLSLELKDIDKKGVDITTKLQELEEDHLTPLEGKLESFYTLRSLLIKS